MHHNLIGREKWAVVVIKLTFHLEIIKRLGVLSFRTLGEAKTLIYVFNCLVKFGNVFVDYLYGI